MSKERKDKIWGPSKMNDEVKSVTDAMNTPVPALAKSQSPVGRAIASFGLPRLIITCFHYIHYCRKNNGTT